MPGVRINQLLASTAVALLLAGAPAVTLAGPSDTATTAAAPDTVECGCADTGRRRQNPRGQ